MRQSKACGRGNMYKEKKKEGKERDVPQTQAHQLIWDGWQMHLPYA